MDSIGWIVCIDKHERYSQAVRNRDDLECLACPPKYRDMQTFHKYYSGAAIAPYPTLFSKPLLLGKIELLPAHP